MIAWLTAIVGSKLARPVLIGGTVLLVVLLAFGLGYCSRDDDALEAQVEQTNRSGEAVADAAEMAIDTIGDRTATDAEIDDAVQRTVDRIAGAEDADAVRNAVITGLCGQREHRNDPACTTNAEKRQ
jgi:tRNA A37 N6-isopentenylltransferase MiaA